jgi:nitrogen fixation protein NifQ
MNSAVALSSPAAFSILFLAMMRTKKGIFSKRLSAASSQGSIDELADEFDDLVALLLDHRGGGGEETEWLACAMATACCGDDHL